MKGFRERAIRWIHGIQEWLTSARGRFFLFFAVVDAMIWTVLALSFLSSEFVAVKEQARLREAELLSQTTRLAEDNRRMSDLLTTAEAISTQILEKNATPEASIVTPSTRTTPIVDETQVAPTLLPTTVPTIPATPTSMPPSPTATLVPPTLTRTPVPPTRTPVPPTPTPKPEPPEPEPLPTRPSASPYPTRPKG